MTIAVTGATGQFGGLVVDGLVERGVLAGEIVAIVRDSAKASSLRDRGVQVRVANYSDPDALKVALDGVDKLLLVSGSDVGQRIAQHENVIDAAEGVGVSLIAYTSILNADTSGLGLAVEHRATEKRLAESVIPAVLLRNGWYWENYASSLQQAIDSGTLLGAAGDGKVAGAARADFAAAAVEVLLADNQGGTTYELGGDDRLTYTELAAVAAEFSGKPVTYKDVSVSEYRDVLTGAGLPEFVVDLLSGADAGIARGDLDTQSGDLRKLIGRASTPAVEVLR